MKSEAEASGEDEERSGDPPSRAFLERWADSHGDRFGSEVASLRLVTSQKLLKTDEYCGRLRSSTFLVALSPAATELLGEFLVTSGNAAVLKIFNERVTLEDASEDESSESILRSAYSRTQRGRSRFWFDAVPTEAAEGKTTLA